MKNYILDANALVRYIRGTEGADKVRAILQQSERGLASIEMSVINLGEVYYILMRYLGEPAAVKAVNALRHVVSFMPMELEHAIEAAKLKEQFKMGYADSFAAALALRIDGILVSADPVFDKLGKSIKRLKLPRHS
jgi:predicted nucleic acid-binding protein